MTPEEADAIGRRTLTTEDVTRAKVRTYKRGVSWYAIGQVERANLGLPYGQLIDALDDLAPTVKRRTS
jgi:hypothetical protein